MIDQNIAESLNRKTPEGLDRFGHPYRVLIVDDSPVMRKMIGQILRSEAYEIAGEAGNGLQALGKYKGMEPRPHIVTLDVNMPVKNGVETLQELIDFDPEIRVVMLSGEGQKNTVLNAIGMGAKNYIVKPPERRKVLEKIKTSLAAN